MTSSRPWRILGSGLVTLVALAAVLPAFAAPPDIVTFRDSGTDYHLSNCGTFYINGQYEEMVEVTTFYDRAGNPVQLKVHVVFNGQLTNETTGQTLLDRQRYTVFVDLRTDTVTTVGLPARLLMPGAGVIIRDAGKIVFDPATGTVFFEGGPHPMYDLTQAEGHALVCSTLG